ncbi:complex I NDUFA9 subunit family protein [Thermopetrobacter sp. TC1]|uniref:complex I NDUFA9 subunit family protein n=1 Tax=Thermopetrobacter sp. TC1 TaxID=1495045 RepID=UPI00068E6BC4|nr:complex I NDUFA9 subunit family protein [Thermopetrobacter sp. TC1]
MHTAATTQLKDEIVSVIGGSGFIGRHVVAALARSGYRVRVLCRRPDLAYFLQPLGIPGQIALVQANVRKLASLKSALAGSHAVMNLVGIIAERGAQTFEAIHVHGAEKAARAAREAGVDRFIHMSALGADFGSPSRYGRTKAEGERRVRAAMPQAVILRPSVVVGPEDSFFNKFAEMARFSPVLPLIGGGKTRFQPVYVEDVAKAAVKALEDETLSGKTLELGGPEVWTFRELMEYMLMVIRRRRMLVSVPFGVAKVMAWPAQFLPGPPLTPDQVKMLMRNNVVSDKARAEGRTLEGIGIEPDGIEAVVPDYLVRYRPAGQFTIVQEALAELSEQEQTAR